MLLQNMYTTYRDQLIVEGVALPKIGAYYVLLNKIRLAREHPELAFNILNEKDETGNTVSTVATVQLNGHQLAHAQALYNKDNNAYYGVPTDVLLTLGLNPKLTNGTLDDGEDVGSNVEGSQDFTDEEVSDYAAVLTAMDNTTLSDYGSLHVATGVDTTTTPPPPPPNDGLPEDTGGGSVETPGDDKPPTAGGGVGSGGK